jgi:hypothetical protein
MADNLVYEESLNTESDTSEFISKKWVYVNDNNAQNYTSQVVIDSTPLSNAGGWINWSEGFIVMPLVVQLTGNGIAAGTNEANYAWAFKSGFWQMISSMTVEFNNQNIIQQTPFLNVFRSFKANTSFSQDDLKNEGSSLGFFPDTATSWSYTTNFSAGGDNPVGVTSTVQGRGQNIPFANNADAIVTNSYGYVAAAAAATPAFWPVTEVAGVPTPAVDNIIYAGAATQIPANSGMAVRQSWNNYNTLGTPAAGQLLGQGSVNNLDTVNSIYRTAVSSSAAGTISWRVYAKIRLKDIADYFEKCPLLKGSTIRFYINTNQSIVNYSLTNATVAAGVVTANPILTVQSVQVVGGTTCPLMVTSASLGQGSSPLLNAGAGTLAYALSVSIFKNNFSSQLTGGIAAAQSALSSCRLYAPVYYMNPLAESKYLSLAPTKKIMYKDIFQYQFSNIVPNDNFNFLVTNGISNICSVLVVPFISQTNKYTPAAGGAQTTIALPSYLSPVCSSPASPDPIAITNFNILVSGVNLFLNNELYDFEAFRTQLLQSNQINGSLTTGLASGLISEIDFSNLYRYYYGDASRILPSEQGVSRSVQIVGQNASKVTCDLMVFVEFMREMTIDISTGARIE